jgi:hypothetical protein
MRAPEFSASRRSIAEEQPVLRAKTITESPSASSRKVQVTVMHLGDDGQVSNEHRRRCGGVVLSFDIMQRNVM